MLSFALWAQAGCNSSERVSVRAFAEKVKILRVGQTNGAKIEALLGAAHVVERNRLTYYFADSEFGVGVRRYTPPSGLLPTSAGAFPRNTRNRITVSYTHAGNLQQVAVERFLEAPFINDYSYAIDDTAKDPLEAIRQIAAANGFKAIDTSTKRTIPLPCKTTEAKLKSAANPSPKPSD